MYSRHIPIAEKQIVCFQSNKVKICRFSNNYYIYLKRYFEIFVSNDFFKYILEVSCFNCVTNC